MLSGLKLKSFTLQRLSCILLLYDNHYMDQIGLSDTSLNISLLTATYHTKTRIATYSKQKKTTYSY